MERQLRTFKGHTKTLLDFGDFKSIKDARKKLNFEGTNKELYEDILEQYNDAVREAQKADKKAKRAERRAEAQRIQQITRIQNLVRQSGARREVERLKKLNFMMRIQSQIEFDYTFTSLEQFISYIRDIPYDMKFIITLGGFNYTLNQRTRQNLETLLLGEEPTGNSDAELRDSFTGNTTVHFKRLPEATGYSLNEGGFFAFTHNMPIDLTDFQIMNINEFNHKLLQDNCFIYALKKSEIMVEQVPAICAEIIGRDIPQRKLKEIAEKFEMYITVEKPQDASKTKTKVVSYGVKTNPHLRLGLIDEHYFLIKDVEYTSYSIKNYELVKDKERWYEHYKIDRKSRDRFINSYDLIVLMKACGYFKPLELCSELMKSVYHDKIDTITYLDECNEKNSRLNEYIEKEVNDFVNVVLDFESTTEGKIHKPYMVHIYREGELAFDKTFYGLNCAKNMFYYLSKLNINVRLLAHNAGYDIRFIYEHLCNFSMINRSKFLLRGYGSFYYGAKQYFKVEIQDTYAIISNPLRDFGKMFKLDVKKEIMPYHFYTEANVEKQIIELPKTIEGNNIWSRDDHKAFIENCIEWKCIVGVAPHANKKEGAETGFRVDIIKYSQIYCRMDCIVLWQGYNKFKSMIQEVCELNIDYYISSASIAHDYMLKEGVYEDCYALASIPREFIQRAMVGGRTMMRNNKSRHIKKNVDDFDAVSLYPSAMKRIGEIGGYLKGLPKIITDLSYEFLRRQDGYFVEIRITNVGKGYGFPLMSKMGGVRDFTNDMIGEIIVVDKFMLEDLIQFQEVEFEVIKGYYYDEGRNNKIYEVITHLFDERKKEKANKNPVEQIYKLIMNSAYGKSLLKPFDTESKYVHNIEQHTSKYYKHIKEIVPLHNETYKVEHYKSVDEHFNNCYVGIEVLSMSKRIMNEVMCLAEDEGLNMYYQDTDSIHIDSESVSVLADAYKSKYARELIGKDMGQFHTDFSSDTLKGDLVSVESIYLGKKCYIDKLSDGNGIDYHIRMKGIPTQSIKYYAQQKDITVFEVYERLSRGNKITFDLACGGTKCCFEFLPDMTIKSLYKFERDIQFNKITDEDECDEE